jgi:lauroyl/myristoyl acyltransferase
VTAAETRDLSAAIEAAGRPLEPPAMPPADLRVRLGTSSALRHVLPTRLAVRRAMAKGAGRWENPGERRRALVAMNAIVGGTARAGEVEELARRRLIEEEAQRALFWAPWRTVSVDAVSSANLHRALSANRRLLVSACHLGPYFLTMSAFTSLGHSTIAVSAPWFFREPLPDYWGRRLARWRRGIYERHERLASSAGGFPVIKALLEQGEVVLNYFDMPGSSRTRFLGKPVMLTGGSAQLAFQTDALILPLRARRAGARVWADVWEPLDSRGFAGAEGLHEALAEVHERSILELPETLEDPNRAGAWEHGATVSEWARPQPNGRGADPGAG